MIVHPLEPIFDEKSKILILGTFPSVKSRENNFYYGHPQNRFWKVISNICNEELPLTNNDKRFMLLNNNIAVWDVIHSCDIDGSADSTIRNVAPNDIKSVLYKTNITKIFVNGKKADSLYKKHIENEIGIKAICLPSTSSANASWSLEKLVECWNTQIKGYLI